MLELKEIVGGYGKMTILNGISFKIEPGTITTVIGPNGAGKSTVFKAIFGMLKIDSGRVLLKGNDVTKLLPAEMLARGVSYVPQGRNIFPQLSVLHNLEIGGISAPSSLDIDARIETVMDQFPMLREKEDDQASTLSGGQQKQLEIARALLLEPELMLVDEPSIGLSPKLVRGIFATLTKLRDGGVTILMVEQNAKQALAVSDFGIVLELGRMRMHGKASELLEDPRIGQLFLGGGIQEKKPAP
jgi:branched-chain amino acid transport system ATP-binding protein